MRSEYLIVRGGRRLTVSRLDPPPGRRIFLELYPAGTGDLRGPVLAVHDDDLDTRFLLPGDEHLAASDDDAGVLVEVRFRRLAPRSPA